MNIRKRLVTLLLCVSLCFSPIMASGPESIADNMAKLTVSIIEVGIGIWGIKQATTYGVITGSLILIDGVLTYISIGE